MSAQINGLEKIPVIIDGYIDNEIGISVDKGDWVKRASFSIPLAAYAILWSVHKYEPIPWPTLLITKRIAGDGCPEERKIYLGWLIYTMNHKIYLPATK